MKNLGIGIAALVVIALLLFLGWRSQHVLEAGLPPRIEASSQIEANRLANGYAHEHGGTVIPVLGTGSMAPYIPAAAAGKKPLDTMVAYVVTDPRATYSDIAPGRLCIYRADWNANHPVLHGAAQKDGDGWIMSGLHNEHSEARWRVTQSNFIGIVGCTFTWNQ